MLGVRYCTVCGISGELNDKQGQQLTRVEAAFYDDKTRPTDLKALSVEMRELRGLIKAAEAAENKTLSVVADTADEPLS